ncbi:MAG: hypothetical protein M1820_009575 [Bogoriella megaspora]|nr:MAG: hypothetical protein M1820_009575 [Bogoriella megaspora]
MPAVSSSSENEDRQPARKRQRTSKGNGEDKKARGRPRLDPQDETAAERRRTQIRLAQRAYRQRKETTISALNKQVADLQNTISELSKSFLRFSDLALNASIPHEISQELKNLTQDFIQYSKTQVQSEGEEDELVDDNKIVHNLATEPPPRREKESGSTESPYEYSEDIGLGYQSVYDVSSMVLPEHEARSPTSEEKIMSRIEEITQDSEPPARFEAISQEDYRERYPHADSIPCVVRSYHARITDQLMPMAAINDLDKSSSLNNKPFVYSFQETTFARRLQRAAVECGYHLIAQAHLRPRVFKRVFKLSLLYGSREQIATRFKSILTKSTSESLEFWQTPFIRLGGAGTHFPRRNLDGTPLFAPNAYNVHPIAPNSNVVQLRNAENNEVYCDMLIDITGYEGDWFDPIDVEGYLTSKGIHIDPQSSFADVQMLEADLPELGMSPHESSGSSSSNPTTPLVQDASAQPYDLDQSSAPFLSQSFFNDLDKNHMRSMSPIDSTLAFEDLDPLTTNTSTSRRPSPSSRSSSHNSPATLSPPSSLMAPSSYGDISANAYIDNFLPNPLKAHSNIHADFDSIDLDNLAMEDANNWGFDSMAAFNGVDGLGAALMGNNGNMASATVVPPMNEPKETMPGWKNVTIDVTRMIEELLKGGVCLGRTPGFRKKDVDRALETAMIAAF